MYKIYTNHMAQFSITEWCYLQTIFEARRITEIYNRDSNRREKLLNALMREIQRIMISKN